jgi:hypothetical protein
LKCAKHPRRDAIAVCISCGIGVCRDCEIKVLNRTHCKECVEAGRATAPTAPPTPGKPAPIATPTGIPSKGYYNTAAIGLIILMVGANLMWISQYIAFGWILSINVPHLVGVCLFCAGGVMGALAIYGFYRNYGLKLAYYVFIISMVFIWFLLVPVILNYAFLVTSGIPSYANPAYLAYIILHYLGYIFVGVMVVLWGVVWLYVRNYMGIPGLALATSILFLITGSFFCTVALAIAGQVMLVPSGILAIITLFTTEVRT